MYFSKISAMWQLLFTIMILWLSAGGIAGQQTTYAPSTSSNSQNKNESTSKDSSSFSSSRGSAERHTHINNMNYNNDNNNNNNNHASGDSSFSGIATEDDIIEDARRQKLLEDKKRVGMAAAKQIMHASSSEYCDWRRKPLSLLKGELCGSYYKVLNIDRQDEFLDKSYIKKAYRKTSLAVHPDKNPVDEADAAFHIVQEAYECLNDDECKEGYDEKLQLAEEKIYWDRKRLRDHVVQRATHIASRSHHYVTSAANQVYHTGMDLWDMAGEWNINMFGERWPLGKALLITSLMLKGQLLLKMQLASYLIIKINGEIAKARSFM